MFRLALISSLAAVTMAVTFTCSPSGNIDVSGLDANKYEFAVAVVGTTYTACTFSKSGTTGVISGAPCTTHGTQILFTVSDYANLGTNSILAASIPASGNGDITTYAITCNNIAAGGVVQTLNQTLAPSLVTQAPAIQTPSYTVTSSLSAYTANVGDSVDWILTVPLEYTATVEGCTAYASDPDDATNQKQVTLMTNNCAGSPALMKSFPATYTPVRTSGSTVYTTQLTAFQFYGYARIKISCSVKVCPSNPSAPCEAQCSSAGRRRRDTELAALSTKDAASSDGTFLYQTQNVLYVNDPFTLSAASFSLPSVFAIAFALFAAL